MKRNWAIQFRFDSISFCAVLSSSESALSYLTEAFPDTPVDFIKKALIKHKNDPVQALDYLLSLGESTLRRIKKESSHSVTNKKKKFFFSSQMYLKSFPLTTKPSERPRIAQQHTIQQKPSNFQQQPSSIYTNFDNPYHSDPAEFDNQHQQQRSCQFSS